MGPCVDSSTKWFKRHDLPSEVLKMFQKFTPKSEVWAGAGVLYDERRMIKYNNDFPEALQARLLIVGSAANGDHISIDLLDGSIGYISHEHNWTLQPRRHFVSVSPSFGRFLRDINEDPPKIADDYWSAKSRQRK